jgi:hypothetical protein
MPSNDNDKHKMEEEVDSSTARKRLWHTNDNGRDDDSSNSLEKELPEEETEEEVSLQETSMNQYDTSEEKLYARCARIILFKDDGDTPSTSLTTHTGKSSALQRGEQQ